MAPERAFANVELGPAEKRAGGIFRRTLAQTPGGSLDPKAISKYQTPLLIPPAMPRASRITVNGQAIDYYEIAVRQFQEQILPAGLPATTVWGYGPKVGQPAIFNAPSLTIEATAGIPTRIKWINELVAADGTYLPHLLAVDPTLHWANPPGGAAERDTRPTFTTTPGPYTGPVPMVTHVHGAVGVVMKATAMPRRGICPPPITFQANMPLWAPGMTASRPRPTRSSAWHGGRVTPPSSIPTRTAPHHLVPRSCARHEAVERVCRAGRLLHRPRRTRRRFLRARLSHQHCGEVARTGASAVAMRPERNTTRSR